MKNIGQNLQLRIASFMRGRYGSDALNNTLAVVVIVLMMANLLLGAEALLALAYAGVAVVLFRCFSRNIAKRRQENETWLRISAKPRDAFKTASLMIRNRKTTLYLRCPECKQLLSVPRGKGTLRVTCPKCKHQTSTKS